MFAGTFNPKYWAFCQGQLLPIAQNTALFSILGTTYGGNGQTTFALPDFRGRNAIQPGQGPGLSNYSLGQIAGQETVTLIPTEMPAHTHTLAINNNTAVPAASGSGTFLTSKTESGETIMSSSLNSSVLANTASLSMAGGSQPHNNMPPYLAMNYIICLIGIFPSRD